jgi:crotonobetainyl-CoA:carnitine CoA-transferase CaiB-like acyl-CoA transferase
LGECNQFHNKNAGKRGLSLNVRNPKGLQIAKDLIRQSDIVAEGFSPGVLERLGLGYDVLRSIRPDIIYIQQAGMGGAGRYGRFRTVGPIAASFAGATDMSGLPEPAMSADNGTDLTVVSHRKTLKGLRTRSPVRSARVRTPTASAGCAKAPRVVRARCRWCQPR